MIIATFLSYMILAIGTLPLALDHGTAGMVIWLVFWAIMAVPTSNLMVKFAVRYHSKDDEDDS